ncbi:MAG: zinc ABC transporter substrate-binding protein [Byssovorax sp.]
MRRLLLLLLLVLTFGCTPAGEKPGPAATTTAIAAVTATAATGVIAPPEAPAAAPIRALDPQKGLRVGVTLHPYYSWTKNITGDLPGVEVRPILPGEVDAGNYQPRPEDIQKLKDLDALVINGIGHDDFITSMIEASGNTHLTLIRPNDGVPLIRSTRGGAINSHTFISFTNAAQQTYAIERALSALRPDLAARFHDNAAAYAKKLRQIKADAAAKLARPKRSRVVTVHDGYSYLCQEFGIDVAGVVEPAHGLVPSAAELGDMIDLLKHQKIEVVLSEETFPDKLLGTLRDATGVRVYIITHIASGAYTADKFEKEMQTNADTLIAALTAP